MVMMMTNSHTVGLLFFCLASGEDDLSSSSSRQLRRHRVIYEEEHSFIGVGKGYTFNYSSRSHVKYAF